LDELVICSSITAMLSTNSLIPFPTQPGLMALVASSSAKNRRPKGATVALGASLAKHQNNENNVWSKNVKELKTF